MAWYLDTSAAAKLVVAETETPALLAWIDHTSDPVVACDLLRTELLRAVRRVAPDRTTRARAVLDSVTLLTLATSMFERAAFLDPVGLRILDALHLAAALDLGDDLDGIVTYDARLREAASALGMTVVAPA
jgi:predicted nucleic acid-binding protein